MIIKSIHHLKGQDYCAQTAGNDWEAVVVADGISATYKAEWAAKFAVNTLITRLQQIEEPFSALFFQTVFAELPGLIREQLPLDFSPVPTPEQIENGFGTTLICGVRQGETYWFAYVGNGGIIHVRSRYLHQSEHQYPVPWSSINLLNPHTVEQGGQERLYRYISPSALNARTRTVPTVICMAETPDPGDYFILCTDGIFSNDHLPFTHDDAGRVWLRYEERLRSLYDLLHRKTQPTQQDLDDYLENLCATGQLDDDATISILWNA